MVIVLGTEDIEKILVGQLLNFTINHSKKKWYCHVGKPVRVSQDN